MDNKPTIDDLKELENRKGITVENVKTTSKKVQANKAEKEPIPLTQNIEEMLAEYEWLDKSELPHKHFYPENWDFYIRQPKTTDVAIFSTIPENDYFKIMSAVIALVRKNIIIFNSETNQQISTERIKSCHKMFLFIKLRNLYMKDIKTNTPAKIKLPIYSLEIEEAIEIEFDEYSLMYNELSDEALTYLNAEKTGFNFDENWGAVDNTFIPIIDFGMETKIINFITNSYKKMQNAETKKKDFDSFDKTFLAFVSYLFDTPNDSIESLKTKFKRITEDEQLYQFYNEMVTNFKLGERDNIKYIVEREGEQIVGETQMKFPNGYTTLFTREAVKSKLFK